MNAYVILSMLAMADWQIFILPCVNKMCMYISEACTRPQATRSPQLYTSMVSDSFVRKVFQPILLLAADKIFRLGFAHNGNINLSSQQHWQLD
jgi:hypothetical protein